MGSKAKAQKRRALGALAPMLGVVTVLLAALMLMEVALPARPTAVGPTEAIASQAQAAVSVPLVSIHAIVPPGFVPSSVDNTVRIGQQGHLTPVVSDLNAAGRLGHPEGRDVQAVAVLIVVTGGDRGRLRDAAQDRRGAPLRGRQTATEPLPCGDGIALCRSLE